MTSKEILDLLTPLIISVLPITLHALDRIFEFVSPIDYETLRREMSADPRPAIAELAAHHERYRAIKACFEFQKTCHFIFSISIFNIAALYVSQVQVTKSFLIFTPVTILGMTLGLAFLVAFLMKLSRRNYSLAIEDPLRLWRRLAWSGFLVVLGVDVFEHYTAH